MSNAKKSFIFYFDDYPILSALPMEQRGLLFSALVNYASRVWQDPSLTMEEVMDSFPKLSQEARLACAFIGKSILRDAEAWLEKRSYRQGKKGEKAAPAAGTDRRAREDMERTRRMMERLSAGK